MGTERGAHQTSNNSGTEPPPPSFSLTTPEESEKTANQGFHGDRSDRQRDDEERGPLSLDLMDDRKDGLADEKQANKTLQVWSLQTHPHTHKDVSANTHF